MGNSGCFPQGKPAVTESRYPTCGARWVFSCFHNPPNSDMGYRIFNVRIDVNACDRTRGCTDTVRESALRVDSGRKIPCRTGESNLRQRRAGPVLYQLSYIPTKYYWPCCRVLHSTIKGGPRSPCQHWTQNSCDWELSRTFCPQYPNWLGLAGVFNHAKSLVVCVHNTHAFSLQRFVASCCFSLLFYFTPPVILSLFIFFFFSRRWPF